MMHITFSKGHNSPDILTCTRQDGSASREELSISSAYHDLAHYAVEKTLGIEEGIWGMLASGFSISTYNQANEERPFQISVEGYRAEYLATLMQSAVPTGVLSMAFVDMLRQACASAGLPFPDLPAPDVLAELIAMTQALSAEWTALPAGGDLKLVF